MFLPYTCDIYSLSVTELRGSSTSTYVSIWSWIPCMFFLNGGWLKETNISQDTDKTNYSAILWNFVNIKQGDIIEPKDKLTWSLWSYKVESFDVNYSKITNGFDNLNIKLSKSYD